LNKDLEPLIKKLQEVSQIMKLRWPGRNTSLELRKTRKPDGSLVTEIDLESNRILTDFFATNYPGHHILSEEALDPEGSRRAEQGWIIDPLDGTEIYAKGERGYAIFCGERKQDQIVSGVAIYPELDILLEVTKSNGGTINGLQLQSKAKFNEESSCFFVEDIKTPKVLNIEKTPSFEVRSMAFKAFCLGEIDGVVMRHPNFFVWDFAPWILACEVAGGVIRDQLVQFIKFIGERLNIDTLIIATTKSYSYLSERIASQLK